MRHHAVPGNTKKHGRTGDEPVSPVSGRHIHAPPAFLPAAGGKSAAIKVDGIIADVRLIDALIE
jgi:hypothetical protein